MVIQKPKRSLRKKIAIVIIILIVLPMIVILFGEVKQLVAAHRALGKVTVAKQKAEPEADQKIARFESQLISSGVVSSKLASSKVDVCYVDHDDQGWFAVNWYQECYLRYVSGFATNLSREQTKQKLAAFSAMLQSIGSLSTLDRTYPNTCEISESSSDYIEVTYLPTGSSEITDYSCAIPNQLQGIGSVRGPIVLDKNLAVKRYQAFNQSDIGRSQNQIWLEHDDYYYHENLGCGFDFIFCGNPRGKPVQAK